MLIRECLPFVHWPVNLLSHRLAFPEPLAEIPRVFCMEHKFFIIVCKATNFKVMKGDLAAEA